MAFVGLVLRDSGEGRGTGPARVLIEERLLGVPVTLEQADIDTLAGSSCYYRLKQGERYVIFAEWKDRRATMLTIRSCSRTFPLRENEHVLDAIRNKGQRGQQRLVGTVRRSGGDFAPDDNVAGAVIVARSATNSYEAFSNSTGAYEIRNMVPDRYSIEITKPGFLPDEEYNRRWSGRLILNRATNTIEPEKSSTRGTVLVDPQSCEVWDLRMWQRGRISGMVRSVSGGPLASVTVQAFGLDKNGYRSSSPLRIAETDHLGRYRIEPLPDGEYVVGVNADKYRDRDPYPPTLYEGKPNSPSGGHVLVQDGSEVTDVNLVLGAKRTPTTIVVKVLGPSGIPHGGASITLANTDGVQRWSSEVKTSEEGILEVPAYMGEQYVVKASSLKFTSLATGGTFETLEGSSLVTLKGHNSTVLVLLGPKLQEER